MKAEHVIAAVILVVVMSAAAACELAIWRECRTAGNSIIYCMRMVSK